jgi:hypothetical protein
MRRVAWCLGIAAVDSFLLACGGGDGGVLDSTSALRVVLPVIQSETISVEQLPDVFDETRTWVFRQVHPPEVEELIREMWRAGIRTRRAWLALDDRCFDPIGPRFTVELETDDPRIGDYGFDRGVGRLFCATHLTEYTVVGKAPAR